MQTGFKQQREILGIQILRGFAALAVTWHHALEASFVGTYSFPPPHWLVLFGAVGVDIFFVISGFIMVYVAFAGDRRPPKPTKFLQRRVIRIMPLYWICCLAMLLVVSLGFLSNPDRDAWSVIKSFLLIRNDANLVSVSWTLSYEFLFYFLFAASLFLRSPKAIVLSCLSLLGAVFVAFSFVEVEGLSSFYANPIVFEFGFGVGLGWLFLRGNVDFLIPHCKALMMAGLVGTLVSSYVFFDGNTAGLGYATRFWAWGIPSALIVMGAMLWEPKKVKINKALHLLGDASYSQYLTHIFVLIIYGKAFELFPELNIISQWVWTTLVTLICVAVGVGTYKLIEKPIDNALKARKRKTTVSAA